MNPYNETESSPFAMFLLLHFVYFIMFDVLTLGRNQIASWQKLCVVSKFVGIFMLRDLVYPERKKKDKSLQ